MDQQAFEGMIEIPVIDDVLVVPDNLSGIGVQRQRAVVVEICLVVTTSMNLGAGEVTDVPM